VFGELFNELLVPHELGHYLEIMSRRIEMLDHWQSELEANQIMVAFWMRDPESAKKFPLRIENATRYLRTLKNPVPPGQDARAYFNQNYDKLGYDPAAYGWFQGELIQTAWKLRGERDLCSWTKINTPKPISEIESR
jgi:hypothetical protein